MSRAARASVWGVLALAPLALLPAACGGQVEDARAAYRAGKYDEAIALYRRAGGEDAAATIGLARALMEVGRHAEAEQALAGAPAALAPALARTLGDARLAQGKLEEARAAYTLAVAAGSGDALSARAALARLQLERGQADSAFRAFEDLAAGNGRAGRASSSASGPSADDLTALGDALRQVGARDPARFREALRAYDRATAADTASDEAALRAAELFLEKYNGADATSELQKLLARNPSHPRALLGLARAKEFEGSAEAVELARKALEVNPGLVAAHTLLARASLAAEDAAGARAHAERALGTNPASLEALTALAAARYFSGDSAGFESLRARIHGLNPRYAELYATLADLSVQTRQYARAVELARRALALDSVSWRAHGLLGINLLRVGDIAAGRASLERAFRGDPFNVWFKNTLDLLDTMGRFTESDAGRFRIALDARESELLGPYVAALAEDAHRVLAQRYRTQLEGPVRIELFSSHADFSVRTVGLAGLGALGASFGKVLVMDSPSAREAGHFNWGSTLWHELAHAFHLQVSDHRVPRWLTEGLAVWEERQARPGWGQRAAPFFLAAYAAGKLPPVSRLNAAFVRPTYPEQVAHAYYQASLVVEMIEREEGFGKVLDLLRAYGEGESTEQAVRSVLGGDLASLDTRFDTWLKRRFARELAALGRPGSGDAGHGSQGDFGAELARGKRLLEEGKHEEGIRHLERAKALFPDWAGPGSPYALLADAFEKAGDRKRAAAELEQVTQRSDSDFDAHLRLALLQLSLGDTARAAAALEGALFIVPLKPEPHARLAELYEALGNHAGAVRERRALVALDPVDRAGALYRLARAHYQAGDLAAARREVLRALEQAPNYEAAQELLLKLRSGARP